MDGTKIAAQGAKLTLTDGRVVAVRFGMRELSRLEDTFGSMQGVQAALTDAPFGSLVKALAIGTQREGVTLDALWDLLEPAMYVEYGRIIDAALSEAFPDEAGSGNDQADPTSASPGGTTTTSPSSSSAAPSGSSGA